MEMVNLIFSAENIRMLVLLAFGTSGYVLIKSQMKDTKHSLKNEMLELKNEMLEMKIELLKAMDDKMDKRFEAFHTQLKTNDFKHLNDTIEALTYTLETRGFLKSEDKAYIDGRLDK